MAFVDQARIQVQAGNGGKGCESHYQDKYTRYPIPDGGDGGRGGNVVFVADRNLQTLLDYRFRQHYVARSGGHASSNNKTGKRGEDCILRVPVGTILWDYDTELLIRDLKVDGDNVIVAKGGEGGRGNNHNRTVVPPVAGEVRTIRLELKIIADVGLVGFPNVGKSTLICAVSKVKSKIANYPFTTKAPVLGIVKDEDDPSKNFVMADLPGLIEGAHEGKGLGHQFLKHAERTKILVHVIDMSGAEGRDPVDDYYKICEELDLYSEDLLQKHRVLVANKMDLPESKKNLTRFKRKVTRDIIPISALEKEGLQELLAVIRLLL
ncbi:MAG: GTPase ObgE [Candidatus Omnitrophica bacterium]|nr:GTPase ObgE [Candidatus Omnitrophota bacterium]MDE2008548.1 GTPase ObgE [Candidatus Omnitrophota bacterium]MDE2214014.1 GTPase ObgE [Candidatus Omnitrophota bacterium]MDE2231008.1 GTPase ObgE [Candidatus Omnitrophota bacterium]